MKHTDRYEILITTTNLLTKMDIKSLEHLRGEEVETALKSTYCDAKNELLAHIRQQVEHIGTIEALTQCFVDACFGFGSLGMRQDRLQIKLLGESKPGQDALYDAITQDIKQDNMHDIGWLALDADCGHQDALNLSQEAFDSNRFSLSSEDMDEKAMAFVFLLDYMLGNGIELDLTNVAQDYQYFSCLRYIINKKWSERSLAGYFNGDGDYVFDGADTDFVKIFADKLRVLLSQAGTKRAEHFKTLQIKQYLHELLVKAYSSCNEVKPLAVYTEVEQMIAAYEHPKGITQEMYEDVLYSSRFAVAVKHNAQGVAYELDIEGLMGLADLLESLGLISLQEVNVIISKIRSICD
jgi:hypothetical protein